MYLTHQEMATKFADLKDDRDWYRNAFWIAAFLIVMLVGFIALT